MDAGAGREGGMTLRFNRTSPAGASRNAARRRDRGPVPRPLLHGFLRPPHRLPGTGQPRPGPVVLSLLPDIRRRRLENLADPPGGEFGRSGQHEGGDAADVRTAEGVPLDLRVGVDVPLVGGGENRVAGSGEPADVGLRQARGMGMVAVEPDGGPFHRAE